MTICRKESTCLQWFTRPFRKSGTNDTDIEDYAYLIILSYLLSLLLLGVVYKNNLNH